VFRHRGSTNFSMEPIISQQKDLTTLLNNFSIRQPRLCRADGGLLCRVEGTSTVVYNSTTQGLMAHDPGMGKKSHKADELR